MRRSVVAHPCGHGFGSRCEAQLCGLVRSEEPRVEGWTFKAALWIQASLGFTPDQQSSRPRNSPAIPVMWSRVRPDALRTAMGEIDSTIMGISQRRALPNGPAVGRPGHMSSVWRFVAQFIQSGRIWKWRDTSGGCFHYSTVALAARSARAALAPRSMQRRGHITCCGNRLPKIYGLGKQSIWACTLCLVQTGFWETKNLHRQQLREALTAASVGLLAIEEMQTC